MKFLRLQHFAINPQHILYIKAMPQQYKIVMNATHQHAFSVVECGLMDSNSVHIIVQQDATSQDYERVAQWIDEVSPAGFAESRKSVCPYTLGDLNDL